MTFKIYGTRNCIDCVETLSKLDEMNEKYEFIEFNDSIKNLKEFMQIRDKLDAFNEIKTEGYVGIPCFYFEDGSVVFNLEKAMEKSKMDFKIAEN